MRRFLISFLVLGLMAGSVATAEAKKKKNKPPKQKPTLVERTVEGSYGPYPAPVTGCNSALGSFACVIIPTRTTEAFFTAKVTDAHGQPVFVQVTTGGQDVARFCGETNEPIRFQPGAELHFFVALPVWGIQLDCPAHSIKTTGTISVTLSNLRPAKPLRSGTIVSGDGWFLEGELGGCQMAPECQAWLQSCHTGLTGRDPAVMASIVDVSGLADGHTPRVVEFRAGDPVGLRWGGIVIQFWRNRCTEIHSSKWRSWAEGRYGDSQRVEHPVIPISAEWMTVTSAPDNPHIVWTLT